MNESPLISLLSERGVKLIRHGEHHHTRQGWVQCDCPFCGQGSNRYHMGLPERGFAFSCWKCGKHSVVETVALLIGETEGKVRSLLKGIDQGPSRPAKAVETACRKQLILPKGLGPLLPPHTRYLRERGFDPESLQELWKIQGIGIAARLAWRIFIPIHSKDEVVSWTTRSISPEASLRYISASETEEKIPHKSLLYGADKAGSAICIVEGPIDAWAIGPGAVATCGIGYSPKQLAQMTKYSVRAICFDNEPQAQRRARDLADALSVFPGSTMVVRLDAKDAAEASRKEIKLLRKAIGL